MKKIIITLTLILTACGGNPDRVDSFVKSPISPASEARSKLEHSKVHEEAVLLAAAAEVLRSSDGLESKVAEHCWLEEEARPKIREACLLAWSISTESSPFLEGKIRDNLRRNSFSRNIVLAAIRKPGFVRSLDITDLQGMISSLQKDPLWIRARTARLWLESNSPSFSGGDELWNRIGTPASGENPAGIFELYQVALRLRPSYWQGILSAHCKPVVLGVGQLRCWRLLSALVDSSLGIGLNSRDLPFLQNRKDSGWLLFERSFPERAYLLKKYL